MSFYGSRNFSLEIVKGNIPGHIMTNVFGFRDNVPAGAANDIWSGTAGLIQWQGAGSAQTISIVSDSAADAQDDIGAREYTVIGLDNNYNSLTEVIPAHATDGTIPVVGTELFLRVNYIIVTATGAARGSNIGNVVATYSITTDEAARITINASRSSGCFITVPAGHTGFIYNMSVTMDQTNQQFQLLYLVSHSVNNQSTQYVRRAWQNPESEVNRTFNAPITVGEKNDVWLQVIGPSGGAGLGVSGGFDILVVDNQYVGISPNDISVGGFITP
jgi:hypothetical protein